MAKALGGASTQPPVSVEEAEAEAEEDEGEAAVAAAAARRRRKLQPRGNVCLQCREQKVLCCGGSPCDRCWRLALPCKPQDYSYTYIQAAAAAADDAAAAGGGKEEEGQQHKQKRQWLRRRRGYCRRRRGKGPREEDGWEPIEGSPLLALAFDRGSPRAHAQLVCEVFMSMCQEGRVLRPKALHFLCVRVQSQT
jgi:hypothetical protein